MSATPPPATPPAPPADDKDWTWVLERVCPECEIDVRTFPKEELGLQLRSNAASWVDLLGSDNAMIGVRSEPTRWSTLEYACHVRDVYRLYTYRLELMLNEDGPSYPNWDQDETAIAKRYDLAEAAVVSVELAEAGETLAAAFDAVTGDQWERTGFRSDGASFTVESFGRYLLHDPVHHLWDVRRS